LIAILIAFDHSLNLFVPRTTK